MHGYYYDQNRVYPPEDQDRRRRQGRGRLWCSSAALWLCCWSRR